MSYFTQKSPFFESNGQQTQELFNTQDFQNSTNHSQLFDFQTHGTSSQQSDDNLESQISLIFEKEASTQQSAHLFSQTQHDFNEKAKLKLLSVGRDSQLSIDEQEIGLFASPPYKRRAYGETPGSNTPGLANKSVSQISASSFGVMSSQNIFGNNYQSPRDQPNLSSQVCEDSISSKYYSPTSDSFLTPVKTPRTRKNSAEDIFTQNDFLMTQVDEDSKKPASSQECSLTFSQTQATLSQSAVRSQCTSLGLFSQHPPSQNQLSQASAVSETIGDGFDIENTVPKSVCEVYKLMKQNNSDVVFTWLISSQLCRNAFPFGTYSNLKLSLLLSLVSMSANSQPLHIAAIGQETSHANIIMRSIGKFAKRFVTSTIPEFEGACNSRDKEINAGPLLLANTGVLFVGEWLRLPKNCETKLMRFIETGRVTMEKVQKQAPLECALWAYWSSSNNLKKNASTVNQFISVFGIPTMIDDVPNDKEIAEHLLSSEDHEKKDTFHIGDDDMLIYLNYAAKLSVTMEPIAEELLDEYYLAVRNVRPEALTPKAFETLKQMAQSHAKLSLRNQVIAVDALVAISVCEKYIRSFFVKDSYSSPPEPQINNLDDIDSYQAQLYQWLETFTKNILHR